MAYSNIKQAKDAKYSKLLSALFCFTSIILLSILSLLNNLPFDIYSACVLLKIVIPGSFCCWFFGEIIGKILDENLDAPEVKELKLTDSQEAYEMPSMFSMDISMNDSEYSDL